ncbi:hypothetical protein AB0I49_24480 [Streptomyces sp. NPDC050617]|uniref:hypothetical protein n=1 Tax=Streptomyces sp. NPDC050617 TaxID=3154628 RepID=UPI003440A7A1
MNMSAVRLRALRAALFTALCVLLSATSHVLLSGAPLQVTTVVALSVAVFVIAYALAGRERGYWHIAALLVPLELAADAVFTTGQDACHGQVAAAPTGGPLVLLCGGGEVGSPLPSVPDAATACWLLLAAHLALGLLGAAWLRRGEAALGQLLRAAAVSAFRPLLLALAALAAAVSPVRAAVRRVARRTPPARQHPLLVHSVVRRGPPLPAIA